MSLLKTMLQSHQNTTCVRIANASNLGISDVGRTDLLGGVAVHATET